MEDSDSGVGSISYSTSTRASSMSGDDRSTAGSRSSAVSLPLSEVSSPAPQNAVIAQQQQQHQQVISFVLFSTYLNILCKKVIIVSKINNVKVTKTFCIFKKEILKSMPRNSIDI